MSRADYQEQTCRSTTILCVRRENEVAIGGDGQVTMDDTVVKHKASKIRRLYHDRVLVGFAGAAGDAFALLERFSGKLEEYQGNLIRSANELVKDWRTDKMLRPLKSLMVVADAEHSLLISGNGEVIEPDEGVLGIGSGGNYAVSAARALMDHSQLSACSIVEESLKIAASICVYTNQEICLEILQKQKT